jgi:hypothetical protein
MHLLIETVIRLGDIQAESAGVHSPLFLSSIVITLPDRTIPTSTGLSISDEAHPTVHRLKKRKKMGVGPVVHDIHPEPGTLGA